MKWVDFFKVADKLSSTPVYMVYGTDAFSKSGAVKFYDMVNAKKDRLVIEEAKHFDIYWQPEYVEAAVEGIYEFLKKYIEK
jgi:fermentation-respiration switch protein FrsA (DUF1100 family)